MLPANLRVRTLRGRRPGPGQQRLDVAEGERTLDDVVALDDAEADPLGGEVALELDDERDPGGVDEGQAAQVQDHAWRHLAGGGESGAQPVSGGQVELPDRCDDIGVAKVMGVDVEHPASCVPEPSPAVRG